MSAEESGKPKPRPAKPGPGKASLPPLHEAFLPREHSFYRPRHAESQHIALTTAAVYLFLPLLLLVVGVRPGEFENRKLAEFPSITDGWGFFTGMERWAADHLPLREQAVSVADGVSRGVFGEPYPFGEHRGAGPVDSSAAPRPSDAPADRPPAPPARSFPRVVEGKGGWLYLGEDILAGCHPQRSSDEVFGAVKSLREAVEKSGRRFVLFITPDKSTQMPDRLPASFVGKACHAASARDFWKRAGAEPGLLDVRSLLPPGEPYQKRDTHWTYESATVATKALAERIEPGVTSSWRTTPGPTLPYTPDLARFQGHDDPAPLETFDLAPDGITIRSRPMDSTFRKPERLAQFDGRGMISEPVGLIGDSFVFNFAQYFAAGFADLSVVHSDTATSDPRAVAGMLADRDVVVFQAAERSLVGGFNALLDPDAVREIADELAEHPR